MKHLKSFSCLLLALILVSCPLLSVPAAADGITVTAFGTPGEPNYSVTFTVGNLPGDALYDFRVLRGTTDDVDSMTELGSWTDQYANPQSFWSSFSNTSKFTAPVYYFCIEVTCRGETVRSNIVEMKNSYYTGPVPGEEGSGEVPALHVTKSPTGERHVEGSNALFISQAEGYSDYEWRVVSYDGNEIFSGKAQIEARFRGVNAVIYQNDEGQECLYLMNLPVEMDGYYIQTKFKSYDGSAYAFTTEHAALLTVVSSGILPAVIEAQPAGAILDSGASTTLSVSAYSPDYNTLKYCWYKNSSSSTVGGELISGAEGPEYVPEEIEGSVFYYCAVYNSSPNAAGPAVFSDPVEVRYNPNPNATPEPVETTPEPVTPTPEPQNGSGIQDSADDEPARGDDHTILFTVAGVLVVALVCLTVIIVKKK